LGLSTIRLTNPESPKEVMDADRILIFFRARIDVISARTQGLFSAGIVS